MCGSRRWMAAAALLAAISGAACGTASGQTAPSPAPAPAAADTGGVRADVRFMQGMLAHHAQALEMTALVPGRTRRDDVRLLAERIDVSQREEIGRMERLLRARGAEVPAMGSHGGHGGHGGGDGHHAMMPGMLTPEEMASLRAATGAEFDRLFLELMIRHHEGALVMVAELFDAPGGAHDSELFQLASDVDADQRSEIDRMRRLLAGPPPGARPR